MLVLLVAIGTALLGEVKIQPFGTAFRFGLGSVFFLLALIFWRQLPLRLTGLVVGLTTVVWRIGLASYQGLSWSEALWLHLPALAYYLTLVFFLHNAGWESKREQPLQLGGLVALADGGANLMEMLVRTGFNLELLTPGKLWALLVVALLRGLAVVLLADVLLQERHRTTREVEEEHLLRRLLVGSNLHMEAFFLHKSMAQVETVMARSHELYQKLKNRQPLPDPLAKMALDVAKEVHEIKKDLKRLEEGLNQLLAEEPVAEVLTVEEILELVAATNRAYARTLGRKIEIQTEAEGQYVTDRIYPLVSILNNLVQNAVEAMEEGRITLRAGLVAGNLELLVADNGPGIAPRDQELVFEPGFTTKFTPDGRPSTGIGLTQVRDMVEHLGGEISLSSQPETGTVFTIKLPL